METNYSLITSKALDLFKNCIGFLWGLLIVSSFSGLICAISTKNSGFLDFIFHFIIYSIEIMSFMFPLLLIILYPILINITWKHSNILPLKPIALFVLIQLFNFFIKIYPLRKSFNAFSNDFSVILFIVFFIVSCILFYLFLEWAKKYKINENITSNYSDENNISHYFYVGCIAIFIAILADFNFYTNLSLSSGILLGASLAFIFQKDKEWKKITLYFLSPEFYREVYDELELENERIKNNILIESRLNALKSRLNNSITYTQKSKTYVATILIKTKNTQTQVKLNNIELRVNNLSRQLLNGTISQAVFDTEFNKLTLELNQIRNSIGGINTTQLLN